MENMKKDTRFGKIGIVGMDRGRYNTGNWISFYELITFLFFQITIKIAGQIDSIFNYYDWVSANTWVTLTRK